MQNVLVIDDEKMILDLVEQALKRYHYQVETTQSAIDGIQKLSSRKFDLVITDVCMPGVDGDSVPNQIRQFQQLKIPVIGLSVTPWMFKNKEFDLILSKPFSILSLVESVRELIGLAVPTGSDGFSAITLSQIMFLDIARSVRDTLIDN